MFVEQIVSPLQQFLRWGMSTGPVHMTPPEDAISYIDGILSLILHREGPFQLELFTVPGDKANIPQHINPGVDSYEVSIAGGEGGYFVVDGTKQDFTRYKEPIFIDENTSHGLDCKSDVTFLSFQQWKGKPPSGSVVESWSGEVLGDEHSYLLTGE